MELRDYFALLRKYWQTVVLCIALAVGIGAALVLTSSKEYRSQTQLFVSTSGAGDDVSTLLQSGQFAQARVQSYADIVGGPLVAQRVAARASDGLTAKAIEHAVSASAVANTVLINVTVTDRSPIRAQQIAAGIGRVFPGIVNQVEAPNSSGGSPVKVSVVKPATFSDSPVSPNVTIDLGLALLVGILAGIGAAVLRATLDNTVKSPDDVQETTGSAAVGVIAYDPDGKKHPLIAFDTDLHGTRAEAFRQLRTNLQFVDIDAPLRSVVITSSVPAEGKTTTVCNLAVTIAQAGARVLLIESDLRRPRVGVYLGIENAVGLTSVLIGAARFEDAVQKWGPGGLEVLPSGPTPPNPSELLGSRGMADLLHSLEDRYDLVILDAPPLLPVTDAAVLAAEASGAVIVVHHGKTRTEQLHRSAESLTGVGARILGCVINFAPRKGPESQYYGYGYSYRQPTPRAMHRSRAQASEASPATATNGSGPYQPAPVSSSNGQDALHSEPLATPAAPPGQPAADAWHEASPADARPVAERPATPGQPSRTVRLVERPDPAAAPPPPSPSAYTAPNGDSVDSDWPDQPH